MIVGNGISNNHCQEPSKSLFSEIILRNIISNSLQTTFKNNLREHSFQKVFLTMIFKRWFLDDYWQWLSQTTTVNNIFARKLLSNSLKQHSQRTSENDFLTYSFQEIILTKIRKKDDFWMIVGNNISKNCRNHFSKEPIVRNKIELNWRNSSQTISKRFIERLMLTVLRNHCWQ